MPLNIEIENFLYRKIMKSKWLVISTGFALFSMFFGSGNLVFPLAVGQESQGHYLLASLGILSTCVIFPLLGMLGMTLYKGDVNAFFGCFGKKGAFLFSLLALSLMGPFGVLARCLTVAHGALLLITPDISLATASFFMCVALFFLAANKSKMIAIVGTLLTPVLLLSIGAIAFFGLKEGALVSAVPGSGWGALKNGFFQGYQTMDLVASFFFSGFVIQHLYRGAVSPSDNKGLLKVFFKSALVGAALLYFVYFILILLGWLYAPALVAVPPQEMLGTIAMMSLGSLAAPCVCVAVILACLTTAVALASMFADFLRKEVLRDKIGNHFALAITLTIGFFVSNLEFAGIAQFLEPILVMIYPALIALTIVNIAFKLWSREPSHWPFTLAVVAKLCWI